MYATAYDSLTAQAGGAAAGRRPGRADAAGGRQVRIPAPSLPADDRDREDVTQQLEHRPQTAGSARQVAHSVLEDWRVNAKTADAVVLVVSELVTNAVEHAQPPLALHLHREHADGRVWVGVSDGGPAARDGASTASCADDGHGRGIGIVDSLADAHGTRTHPGGTTHWAH
ncbi:ATP-binding protein [Streptomyces sp. NPDC002659]|uniref:ATP-binding protein n=1 Tax=Streptomyces sp. NPDC002659 TaxID=3364656 RepID=UPI0036B9CC27